MINFSTLKNIINMNIIIINFSIIHKNYYFL
jgi:hypothetical protein